MTKSKKHGGYCIAGIESDTGKWIRLVSQRDGKTGALFDDPQQEMFPSDLNVLDIYSVPIRCDVPHEFQPENVLISYTTYNKWNKVGRANLDDVLSLHPLESPDYIFVNKNHCLSSEEIGKLHQSLTLVKVQNFICEVRNKYSSAKAHFNYNGISYRNISVTDMNYLNSASEFIFHDEAILVLSLPSKSFVKPSDFFSDEEGKYYKFIAQVFPCSTANTDSSDSEEFELF